MVLDSCNREIRIGSYICYAAGDKKLDFGKVLDVNAKDRQVKVQGVHIRRYKTSCTMELKERTGTLSYPDSKIMIIPPELLPDGAFELLKYL